MRRKVRTFCGGRMCCIRLPAIRAASYRSSDELEVLRRSRGNERPDRVLRAPQAAYYLTAYLTAVVGEAGRYVLRASLPGYGPGSLRSIRPVHGTCTGIDRWSACHQRYDGLCAAVCAQLFARSIDSRSHRVVHGSSLGNNMSKLAARAFAQHIYQWL